VGLPLQPRAILLDALGTLVGLEPPWPGLMAELRARHGIEIDDGQARSALRAEMSYYRAHCHDARDPASLLALRHRCAQIVGEHLGGAVATLGLDALTETLLAALRFHPYPDAQPALYALRERGVKLVVVSNWDVSLHDVLAQTGLLPLLDGVLTSAEFGSGKPAPAIFEAALARAGASPAQALHVGDSLEEDVRGAHAAGIEPLLLVRAPGPLLATGGEPASGDHIEGVRTIGSLSEIVPNAT
jgi:putative hydrolase of the HAD superfamily